MLHRLGLVPVYYWLLLQRNLLDPRIARANRAMRAEGAPDGLPLPPDRLLAMVAGTTGLNWWIESSRSAADSIFEAVRGAGREPEGLEAILDFGCGCGRVLRHAPGHTSATLFGVDASEELVSWFAQQLPELADVRVNDVLPPLPFPSGAFDLVYLLSVFTHMRESTELAWMPEFQRLIKPGGLLIFSAHGPAFMHHLSGRQQRSFDAGELIVKRPELEPSNACTAFHPSRYVHSTLARGYTVRAYVEGGAAGNPGQDLYVFERPRGQEGSHQSGPVEPASAC